MVVLLKTEVGNLFGRRAALVGYELSKGHIFLKSKEFSLGSIASVYSNFFKRFLWAAQNSAAGLKE